MWLCFGSWSRPPPCPKDHSYDLYSGDDYTVPPVEKTIVKTHIRIALPLRGLWKSSSASWLNYKILQDVGVGVIDEDLEEILVLYYLVLAKKSEK